MSQMTWEQRREFVELAQKQGVNAAAQASGRQPQTVRAWARRLNMRLAEGPQRATTVQDMATLAGQCRPSEQYMDEEAIEEAAQEIETWFSDDVWQRDSRLREAVAVMNAIEGTSDSGTSRERYLNVVWQRISDWSAAQVSEFEQRQMLALSDSEASEICDALAGRMQSNAQMWLVFPKDSQHTTTWPPPHHDYIGTYLNADDLEQAKAVAEQYVAEYYRGLAAGATDTDALSQGAPEHLDPLWQTVREVEGANAHESSYAMYVRDKARLFAADVWEQADPTKYLDEDYFGFLPDAHIGLGKQAFVAAVIEATADAIIPDSLHLTD